MARSLSPVFLVAILLLSEEAMKSSHFRTTMLLDVKELFLKYLSEFPWQMKFLSFQGCHQFGKKEVLFSGGCCKKFPGNPGYLKGGKVIVKDKWICEIR